MSILLKIHLQKNTLTKIHFRKIRPEYNDPTAAVLRYLGCRRRFLLPRPDSAFASALPLPLPLPCLCCCCLICYCASYTAVTICKISSFWLHTPLAVNWQLLPSQLKLKITPEVEVWPSSLIPLTQRSHFLSEHAVNAWQFLAMVVINGHES